MRISDWSSDVCSSDLIEPRSAPRSHGATRHRRGHRILQRRDRKAAAHDRRQAWLHRRRAQPRAVRTFETESGVRRKAMRPSLLALSLICCAAVPAFALDNPPSTPIEDLKQAGREIGHATRDAAKAVETG